MACSWLAPVMMITRSHTKPQYLVMSICIKYQSRYHGKALSGHAAMKGKHNIEIMPILQR